MKSEIEFMGMKIRINDLVPPSELWFDLGKNGFAMFKYTLDDGEIKRELCGPMGRIVNHD